MIVIGAGVTAGTTVSRVNEKTITLSASATVANNTNLRFVKNSGTLLAWTFTIPHGGNTIGIKESYGIEDIVGFKNITTNTTGATTGTSVAITAGHAKQLTVGMALETDGISTSENVTIASITDVNTVVLSEARTLASGAELRFKNANTNITPIDITATGGGSSTDAVIKGVLEVNSVDHEIEAYVNIDDILTSS